MHASVSKADKAANHLVSSLCLLHKLRLVLGQGLKPELRKFLCRPNCSPARMQRSHTTRRGLKRSSSLRPEAAPRGHRSRRHRRRRPKSMMLTSQLPQIAPSSRQRGPALKPTERHETKCRDCAWLFFSSSRPFQLNVTSNLIFQHVIQYHNSYS